MVTLPHPSARLCVALPCERAEVLCRGLGAVFERIGRAPRPLVPGDATEAGRMLFGKIVEPRPLSRSRAHCRCEGRCRDPCSGNERGSVEDAVGLLRRNLLVPVPEADSPDGLDERLASGCDRTNAGARNREGRGTVEALPEDLAGMPALPGTPLDAAGWAHARADRRGCVRVDGSPCRAGAWHDRGPLVGVRARTVGVLADRGRHVATPARGLGGGEAAGDPASPMPAPVARPRAFGEPTIRRDMPGGLAEAIDRCGEADRGQAPRVLGRVAGVAGSGAAREAEGRVFAGGRVPDEASRDMLARRIAAGGGAGAAGPDPSACDGSLGRGAIWGGRVRRSRREGGRRRQEVLARQVRARRVGAEGHAPAGRVPRGPPRGRARERGGRRGARTCRGAARRRRPRRSTDASGGRSSGPTASGGTTCPRSRPSTTARASCPWAASARAGRTWRRRSARSPASWRGPPGPPRPPRS